jgi:hypothetical protein
MPDRLNELRRQRELIREHLEWIEREITAAAGSDPIRPVPAAKPTKWSAPPAAPRKTSSAPATGDPDALVAKYGQDSGNVHENVKQGCFLYFALAFVLLGAGVVWLYWHTFHKH